MRGGKAALGSVGRFGPVILISVDDIDTSPFQVRVEYGDISKLAESIKSQGLLEPILVRPKADGRYELVHGHRRLRACKHIGRRFIEAFVKDLSDEEAMELQGSENIQRQDYSAIEEAVFYANYKKFLEKKMGREVSVSTVAKKLSVNETTVRTRLYLLDLPPEIQEKVHRGEISANKAVKLTILAREKPPKREKGIKGGFREAKRTDRWYLEIKRLAKEIVKAENEPLKGLRTAAGVEHAAKLIRNGIDLDEAVRQAQLMEAVDLMKKEFVKSVNPRDVILRVRASQPTLEDVYRSLSEANIELIKKMLLKGILRCPHCGGKDLVWECTGERLLEEGEVEGG